MFVRIWVAVSMMTLCFTAKLSLPVSAKADTLFDKFREIEHRLGGRLGVAVLDTQSRKVWLHRADERFPLNSTFKTLACAAALSKAEHVEGFLNHKKYISHGDIVDWSPVTKLHIGSSLTVHALCDAAMEMSDNTAANKILEAIGGPQELTEYLRSIGDTQSRLDRFEPELNEALPGDVRDTTTPKAAAKNIRALLLNGALKPKSALKLLDWLIANKVSGNLLRAGIPDDWLVGDRTGSGGYGSRSINAIIMPPDRAPVIVTIYITENNATGEQRNQAITEIGWALVEVINRYYHDL